LKSGLKRVLNIFFEGFSLQIVFEDLNSKH